MPPKTSTAENTRRKGPQFKPPRPVKATAHGSAVTKRAQASAAKRATASTARSGFQPAAEIMSSEDEEEDEAEQDDDDDMMEDAPSPVRTTRPPPTLSPDTPIPEPLLSRLLQQNFDNPETKIQRGAMTLVGAYMQLFVREAFARAKIEREMGVKAGGISDGFLQVEDLEKLAPQLVLDF
ncbi:CENP-S associating centromere protein X-domain-containing protein [Phaeosphaeria sp. MPI-PUGE-AT-0046c]|nr:CENP-S associating centromere protein X-domain-containing protein [Phaeosphaeria sp. MPI-PUGE-AT-0046c]